MSHARLLTKLSASRPSSASYRQSPCYSSKFGHGRFQTKEEKDAFIGQLKVKSA
jgi:hypothetical protein